MNKYLFILKFISRKQSRYKYNWSLLFPFAGVIIGCLTVALTISIMEGMEYAIFTKLKNISGFKNQNRPSHFFCIFVI